MKARIKATGEVIEVNCGTAVAGNVLYQDVNTNATYTGDELEPAEPDWQHYRIQFVGQIASAIMSNYEFYARCIAEECNRSGKSRPEMVAQMSVEIADALVAELKKGGQDDGI